MILSRSILPGRKPSTRFLILVVLVGCSSTPSVRYPVFAQSKGDSRKTVDLSSFLKEEVADPPSTQATQTAPAEKPPINAEAMMTYFQARSSLMEKDHQTVIELLERTISLDPDYLPAQNLLMQLLFELGQLEPAEKHARVVLDLDPDDPTAHYILGSILLEKDSEDHLKPGSRHLYRAISLWGEANQSSSFESIIAAFKLGGALAGGDYILAAMEVYEPLLTQLEQLEDDPTASDARLRQLIQIYRPGLYLLMGDFSLQLEQIDEALEYFRKGEQFRSVRDQARAGMIRCLFELGQTGEAHELLNRLTQESGLNEQVIELYQQVYPDSQWPVRIAELYQPTSENVLFGINVAVRLMENEHHALAFTILQKILQVDPAHNQLVWLMIKAGEKTGQMDQTAQALLETVAVAEDLSSALATEQTELDEQAGRQLIEAVGRLEVSEDQEYARDYLLGLANQIEGSFAEARLHYQSSLKLKEDFIPAYLAGGQLLLQEYRWREASVLMRDAIELSLESAGIFHIHGMALMEQGRIAEAVDALSKAVALAPNSDQVLLASAEAYLRSETPENGFDLLKHMISNGLIGPQTIHRLIHILLEAESGFLCESILQQYSRQFGQDIPYRILTAKLNYLKDVNAAKYRRELALLKEKEKQLNLIKAELAELEFSLGNYRQAMESAKSALEQRGFIPPIIYQRLLEIQAHSHWRMLEYEQAENIWRRVLETWPHQNQYRIALARTYIDAQYFQKAQELIEALLSEESMESSQQSQLQGWLINCLMGQDKFGEAIETVAGWIKDAEANEQRQARLYRVKIECLMRGQDHARAVDVLDELIEKQKGPVVQWKQLLIGILLQDKQFDTAMEKVEQYLSEDSETERHFLEGLKISILTGMKDYDEAIELSQHILSTVPEENRFPSTLLLIACYQQADRYDQAIETADKALADYSSETLFAFTLQQQITRSLILAGRYGEAETYLNERIETTVGVVKNQWQQLLIALYFFDSRWDSAIKLLEEILAANPNLGWANNSLGYTLADQGKDISRAEKLIRKALATEPGSGAYLDSLAWVLYRQGKYEQAYTYGVMAVRTMVEPDPVVLDHLGDICLKLGKIEEAKRYWEQAVENSGDRDPLTLEPGMPERSMKKLEKLNP